uniref:Uncharacterized protein n=1 Tax=Anopheles dirus TaxID=7168 RepID=A0A182N3C8_9DIPT
MFERVEGKDVGQLHDATPHKEAGKNHQNSYENGETVGLSGRGCSTTDPARFCFILELADLSLRGV